MEASARRGAEVVRQILTFARTGEGNKVAFQASRLVGDLTKTAREILPQNIQVACRRGDDLGQIYCDPTQLYQALLTIATNSRQMLPAGGTLSIEGENIEWPVPPPSLALVAGLYVRFRIARIPAHAPAPEGHGTTAFKTNPIGPGHSSIQGIIQQHSGAIETEDRPNGGTAINIYIPAVRSTHPPEPHSSSLNLEGRDRLVLVVDDEASIRVVTKTVLEDHGFRVLAAYDGTEALPMFAQNREALKAVIIDLSLPILDGKTTIQAMKKLRPDMKFIAMSGSPQVDFDPETKDPRVAYLAKPFTAEQLLQQLALFLPDPAT
jgi:CheY-like chemotaxis protein